MFTTLVWKKKVVMGIQQRSEPTFFQIRTMKETYIKETSRGWNISGKNKDTRGNKYEESKFCHIILGKA